MSEIRKFSISKSTHQKVYTTFTSIYRLWRRVNNPFVGQLYLTIVITFPWFLFAVATFVVATPQECHAHALRKKHSAQLLSA